MEINVGELVVDTERKERAPQRDLMKTNISYLRGLSQSSTHLRSPSSITATILAMSLQQKRTLK